MARARMIRVRTWDYGWVRFDPVAEPELAKRLLQKFLDNEMGDEIRKFPPAVLQRHAGRLNAPRWSRRFLLVCAEEWARIRR